uniref:Uncharacterized protein n=1 Tax=Podarcis muralis TaxID=64176 RepID=A0A670I4H3_PODMU
EGCGRGAGAGGRVLVLGLWRAAAESAPRKAVAARLAAKWPATPLLLEAR